MAERAESTLCADGRRLGRLVVATGRCLLRARRGPVWGMAGGVAFGATLAYEWKRPIAALLEGQGPGLATRLARVLDVAGSGVAVTVLGLALLLAGRALRRDALADAALVLGAAGAWAWLFTFAGQLALAERRPIDGGQMQWFCLGGHGISGHAAAAALLLAPVRDVLARSASRRVRDRASAAAVAWAALVGWSRMWLGMHYLWNVVLGLAVGFVAGGAAIEAWRVSAGESR